MVNQKRKVKVISQSKQKNKRTTSTVHSIKVGRYRVTITNPTTVLFKNDHITKQDIIKYYRMVWPFMQEHVYNRLLSMQRFPRGIQQEGFFHKDAPEYFPSWIKREVVRKKKGGQIHYVVCNNEATLVYLANYACLTLHVGTSRIDKPMYPDRIVFDLDPSDDNFEQVKWTAFQLKELLESRRLTPFIMTTGSRGLHVIAPITRKHHYTEVRAFADECAQELVQQYPNKLTIEISKEKREERLFIDTLRNYYGATSVAPYSLRAKKGAPIAMPISWIMLPSLKSSPDFTLKNITETILKKSPWSELAHHAVTLSLR